LDFPKVFPAENRDFVFPEARFSQKGPVFILFESDFLSSGMSTLRRSSGIYLSVFGSTVLRKVFSRAVEFIGVQHEAAFRLLKRVVDTIVDSGTRSHVAVSKLYMIPGSLFPSFTRVEVVGGRMLDILERGKIELSGTGEHVSEPVILEDALCIPGGY
jgi:hypothetical protein